MRFVNIFPILILLALALIAKDGLAQRRRDRTPRNYGVINPLALPGSGPGLGRRPNRPDSGKEIRYNIPYVDQERYSGQRQRGDRRENRERHRGRSNRRERF